MEAVFKKISLSLGGKNQFVLNYPHRLSQQ